MSDPLPHLEALARELIHPDARIVLAGDPLAYHLFLRHEALLSFLAWSAEVAEDAIQGEAALRRFARRHSGNIP